MGAPPHPLNILFIFSLVTSITPYPIPTTWVSKHTINSDTDPGTVWACKDPYQNDRSEANCALVAENVFDAQKYVPKCRPYVSGSPQTIVPESPDILCRAYNDPHCMGQMWAPIQSPGMFNLEPDWVLGIICYNCQGQPGGCEGAPYWVDTIMFWLPDHGLRPPPMGGPL